MTQQYANCMVVCTYLRSAAGYSASFVYTRSLQFNKIIELLVGLTLSGWASISAALPAEEDSATASFKSRAGATGSLELVSLDLSAKSATGKGVLAFLEAAVEAAESPACLLLLLLLLPDCGLFGVV